MCCIIIWSQNPGKYRELDKTVWQCVVNCSLPPVYAVNIVRQTHLNRLKIYIPKSVQHWAQYNRVQRVQYQSFAWCMCVCVCITLLYIRALCKIHVQDRMFVQCKLQPWQIFDSLNQFRFQIRTNIWKKKFFFDRK